MSEHHDRPPPPDPAREARALLDEALGADDQLLGLILLRLEQLAAADPVVPEVVDCLARAHTAITEAGEAIEAEASVARLRRLVSDHPELEEPRRQLCYALFNRYCDEGLETYLAELREAARPLPDRDELMGPACPDSLSDDE